MNLADLSNPEALLPNFTTVQQSIGQDSRNLTPSSQAFTLSPASRGIPVPRLAPPSSGSSSSAGTPPSFSASLALVGILSEYSSLLMKESFYSPFIHLPLYTLYSNVAPDMSFLPQTSMAICCGSGINIPNGNRFFRRAVDAARQRLIESFVSTAEA